MIQKLYVGKNVCCLVKCRLCMKSLTTVPIQTNWYRDDNGRYWVNSGTRNTTTKNRTGSKGSFVILLATAGLDLTMATSINYFSSTVY